MISIIVPCYNEEESIPLFYEEIKKVLNNIKCKSEIIFINDGSKDNSLNMVILIQLILSMENTYKKIY